MVDDIVLRVQGIVDRFARWARLGARAEPGPDHELVLAGLRDLITMPSAGDLVVYGIGAPDEHVSFIEERGAHAGPSAPEMQTFVLHPAGVSLPAPLTHPVLLYRHFAAYRERIQDERGTRTA